MLSKSTISREKAQTIAVVALGFIASEPDYLSRFLAITGLDGSDLRAAAIEPVFLTAILDFLMADEKTLVAFAEASNTDPEHVAIARQLLAGPENFEG